MTYSCNFQAKACSCSIVQRIKYPDSFSVDHRINLRYQSYLEGGGGEGKREGGQWGGRKTE